MGVDAINQVADGREQRNQVTFDCSKTFFYCRRSERGRKVQANFVHIAKQQCDSALDAKSDENDVELNGVMDDEDMKDVETGFETGVRR